MDTPVGTVPAYIYAGFQLTFAAITVALVSGGLVERMKFSAWLLFVVLWTSLVYVPIAHWVWGGGWLAQLGGLDFAGGLVVHLNSGVAALVGALMVGRRYLAEGKPSNIPFVVLGAGLLWFGWFGFNAGSAVAASGLAAAAWLNTNFATATAAFTWMLAEWLDRGRPSVTGMASGAVAGLVAITPAAGYVDPAGAFVVGLAGGLLPYLAVSRLKPRLGYDDTLDAFGIHGVGGATGAILTGVFADPSINPAGRGLLFGNPGQVLLQLVGVAAVGAYSAAVSAAIYLLAKRAVGLRSPLEAEVVGLDLVEHGEGMWSELSVENFVRRTVVMPARASIRQVVQALAAAGARYAVVLKDGEVALFNTRTLIRALAAGASLEEPAERFADRVPCLRRDSPVSEALEAMARHYVRAVPVCNRWGEPVGIVDARDLSGEALVTAEALARLRARVEHVAARKVIAVRPDTPLREAVRIMDRERIGFLPVVEGGRLVGIISEADVVRLVAAGRYDEGAPVISAARTRDIVTIARGATLRDAAELMFKHRIRHLPVVDKDEVIGVISIRDIINSLKYT